MAGATFSRIKNWGDEILTNEDLNAEIDNILNNLNTDGINDYSTNSTQMRLMVDPGTVGSESLATSLSGELERLRFVIKRIIGSRVTYWYENPPTSLSDLVAALGTGLPNNRIVSGVTTGNSSMLKALVPNGAAASLLLDGSPTPFSYYINGVSYSISTDVTLTGLGLAPSSNNTCALDNTLASAQQWTKFLGQYGTTIVVNAMGSAISALVGQIAAFKVGATEYFIAYVKSTTELTVAFRGSFFDSTGAAKPAVALTHSTSTITLMRLTWIFANTSGAMVVTYNNPVVSAEQPTSPSTGDYWFDLVNNTWKTYNSTAYVAANAILIGMSMQDTANCVAARTFDTFVALSDVNTLQPARVSNTVIQARGMFSGISVFGTTKLFGVTRPTWDITSDLVAGVTEAASTYYYLYVKETGECVISNISPAHRRDLLGMYHPTEMWRCVGHVFNDSSSNLIDPVHFYSNDVSEMQLMGEITAYIAPGDASYPAFGAFPKRLKQSLGNPGSVWGAAAGTVYELANLVLEPGTWEIDGCLAVRNNTTVGSVSQIHLYVLPVSGTSVTGAIEGSSYVFSELPVDADARLTLNINKLIVTVSGDAATYYLKTKVDVFGSAHSVMGYRITAKRIDTLSGGL